MDYAGNERLIGDTHFYRFLLNAMIIMVIETYGYPLVFYQCLSCRFLDRLNFLFCWSGKSHFPFLIGINNGLLFLVVLHVLALPFLSAFVAFLLGIIVFKKT